MSITPNEYQALAMLKEADQLSIQEWQKLQGVLAVRMQNAIRGLTDEVGELNSAMKRWLEYKQALDVDNIIEEIGDCLWRLAQLADSISVDLETCMEVNLKKLDVRYENKLTDEEAANRDLDKEREVIKERAKDDGVNYESDNLQLEMVKNHKGSPMDCGLSPNQLFYLCKDLNKIYEQTLWREIQLKGKIRDLKNANLRESGEDYGDWISVAEQYPGVSVPAKELQLLSNKGAIKRVLDDVKIELVLDPEGSKDEEKVIAWRVKKSFTCEHGKILGYCHACDVAAGTS